MCLELIICVYKVLSVIDKLPEQKGDSSTKRSVSNSRAAIIQNASNQKLNESGITNLSSILIHI